MAFTNPTAPNITDFATYVANQGVPSTDLPSGTLTGVSIDTSGNLTATASSGTVAVGMVLVGTGIAASTYLNTWNGTSLTGTVSIAPTVAITGLSSVSVLSQYLQWAFTHATSVTLIPPGDMPPILYVLACYNVGMHQLLKIAQDQSGQSFFQSQRTSYSLLSFVAGPVISSQDNGTGQTLAEPEFLKGLTVSDLDLLKTPWGREYLSYSQQYGSTIVGVS